MGTARADTGSASRDHARHGPRTREQQGRELRQTLELRHLTYFVAVAEELHFSRAAERLHIAQPAVSEQVRKLEEELGVRLLNRTKRTVSVTDAGAALLVEARRVLQQVEMARRATHEVRDRLANRLRIGYTPASLPTSLSKALQQLAGSFKGLETILEAGFGMELIAAVRDERLDAAIVSMPAPTAGLRTTQLGYERAVAALPETHRHAVQPAISLARVAPERIVLLPREASRPFYDAVIAACQNAGLSPSLVETPGTSIEPALLAVASGAGIGLLPESVARRYSTPGVRFVSIDGEQPAVATAIVTRRDSAHLPTAAFVRTVPQVHLRRTHVAPAAPVATAA
jgi:DNA-binding transcriptional LysR family regulator